MNEKMAKGAVLNGYLKFIKKKWGLNGLKEAMAYANIKKEPRDGEWGLARNFDLILEWIAKNKGMKQVKEAGRYSAKDLGVFGYIFGAVVGAEKLLKRMEATYPTMFNYGKMVIEIGDKSAVINIKGAAISDYDCPAWEGGLIGLMEIARSNGRVKVRKPENPEDCRYMVEWD